MWYLNGRNLCCCVAGLMVVVGRWSTPLGSLSSPQLCTYPVFFPFTVEHPSATQHDEYTEGMGRWRICRQLDIWSGRDEDEADGEDWLS
ncbi:uncharacterized protein BDW70DRAFT_134642 [Aspergillus foveolatus]|uniref:uncharacterized protein n=1 Tax=Aspergillus foveolatus TaxID=210207 RepID=UPI003CCE2880